MKKWLALTVMIAGIVLLGWGIWQIASTHLQTAQSLEAAKKAVADDQRMSKKQFSPEVGKASDDSEIKSGPSHCRRDRCG